MKFAGIDLAAKEKNITGIAIIEERKIKTWSVHRDSEIISKIIAENPDLIAIDSPMSLENREGDKYLRKYGAMSLKIPAMRELAVRGMRLRDILKNKNFEVIEVFPTATAKILGFYNKNKKEMLYFFSDFSISDVRNEHEVDAIIAAYTALLYHEGETKNIDGIIIPREK